MDHDPEESPRTVVSAANRIFCDYSPSTHAFPTAVFAGGHCGNEKHIAASVQHAAEAKARGKTPWSANRSLSLRSLVLNLGHESIPRLKPRNGRVTRINGFSKRPAHHSITKRSSSNETMTAEAPLATPERPRSCAIAIQRQTDPALYTDEDRPSPSLKAIYDHATWQMYARITNYRRRYPPCQRLYTYEVPHSELMANTAEASQTHVGIPDTFQQDRHERFYDGEIFEMEL